MYSSSQIGSFQITLNNSAQYAISVQTDGNGTASASSTSSVAGAEITLTATPNSGYQFKQWQVVSGGVTVSNNKFTMPANAVTVKAIFELLPPNTYAVTMQNDGNGTASANPTSATVGTEITLTATPNSGYQFKQWQVVSGGVTVSNNKFTMPANAVIVKAIFEPLPLTDAQAVAADKAALNLPGSTTTNLTLPGAGSNGTTITWTSSNAAVISADGRVTRPAAGAGDATVKLTATITKGGVTETKEFTITVPQQTGVTPTRVPRPIRATGAPRPTRATGAPRPTRATGAPRAIRATRAPRAIRATRVPRPTRATRVPRPTRATRAPRVIRATRAPRVIRATRAPRVIRATRAPRVIRATGVPRAWAVLRQLLSPGDMPGELRVSSAHISFSVNGKGMRAVNSNRSERRWYKSMVKLSRKTRGMRCIGASYVSLRGNFRICRKRSFSYEIYWYGVHR